MYILTVGDSFDLETVGLDVEAAADGTIVFSAADRRCHDQYNNASSMVRIQSVPGVSCSDWISAWYDRNRRARLRLVKRNLSKCFNLNCVFFRMEKRRFRCVAILAAAGDPSMASTNDCVGLHRWINKSNSIMSNLIACSSFLDRRNMTCKIWFISTST
jgi:hypothetical protein